MKGKLKYPIVHITKSGKRYFVVHERKIYISRKMSQKEIYIIYKLLLKNLKVQKNSPTNVNKATAIIKQYINHKSEKKKSRKRVSRVIKHNNVDHLPKIIVNTTNPGNNNTNDLNK